MNGIVYGREPKESLKIDAIKILQDKIILVTFSTGETRLFDASILSGAVFDKLKDNDVFNSAVLEHGVLTWDNGEIDCAPEFIYENSYEYPAMEVV
jgi:hypothetical protein